MLSRIKKGFGRNSGRVGTAAARSQQGSCHTIEDGDGLIIDPLWIIHTQGTRFQDGESSNKRAFTSPETVQQSMRSEVKGLIRH